MRPSETRYGSTRLISVVLPEARAVNVRRKRETIMSSLRTSRTMGPGVAGGIVFRGAVQPVRIVFTQRPLPLVLVERTDAAMHERCAAPVSSGQPSGGASIDLVGGFLGWRQDRVIDNDINGFRQRRQVGISKVESNRACARPLEHPALLGIREPRDREDFVVLGEFDSDWECH